MVTFSSANAVGSGRQRQLLQQAQNLAAQLRELPAGEEGTATALPQILDLARLIRKLRTATASLEDVEQRAIWQQRGAWLHEELVALTAERLQTGKAEDFWSNVVTLLYLGLDANETDSLEKAKLAEALQKEQERAEALQERLVAHQQATTSQRSADSVSSAEMLELRTKLVVAQQEVQRRASDSRDMLQRLQGALAERDNWCKQHAALAEEKAAQQADFDRQAKVIAQLTQRAEQATAEGQEVVSSTAELRKHNHTLSVNLENHARVVEKLISLNAELMDIANARAAPHAKPALAGDGVHAVLANGSSQPRSLPVSTNAWQPNSAVDPLAAIHMQGAMPATASLESQTSLGAAFDAFLRDDDGPQHAVRLDLELPGPQYAERRQEPQQAAVQRSGLSGMLFKAANLAMYVAGSDRAIQQRAVDLGEAELV